MDEKVNLEATWHWQPVPNERGLFLGRDMKKEAVLRLTEDELIKQMSPTIPAHLSKQRGFKIKCTQEVGVFIFSLHYVGDKDEGETQGTL